MIKLRKNCFIFLHAQYVSAMQIVKRYASEDVTLLNYLVINLLKPSSFFYVPQGLKLRNSTWCSLFVECFVRISEQTTTSALYITDWLVFITVVEGVYCAVRTDSLYKADYESLKGWIIRWIRGTYEILNYHKINGISILCTINL